MEIFNVSKWREGGGGKKNGFSLAELPQVKSDFTGEVRFRLIRGATSTGMEQWNAAHSAFAVETFLERANCSSNATTWSNVVHTFSDRVE